jgi:hypothetical protein
VTWPAPFAGARIALHVRDRIAEADAARQTTTAREILRRLAAQPGLVLADEVGMGKTFVALAVAVSAMWADKGGRPVVVMVPPSVRSKWLTEWEVFREKCIADPADRDVSAETAHDALDLFRLLDDPRPTQRRIVFLTHGAFHRNLQDPWLKLAILRFALHHAKLGDHRDALLRFAPDILRVKAAHDDPALFRRLLRSDFAHWRSILAEHGDDRRHDPIPEALTRVLAHRRIDLTAIRERLFDLPLRASDQLEERLRAVRQSLNDVFQDTWRAMLGEARFRSPLLILDEAHHVKNPETKLASLFETEEAEDDARLLTGALAGRFERMLFLTATPFQLGHHELLEVIARFQGVDWRSLGDPDREAKFAARRVELRSALDEAQVAASDLDAKWGKLRAADLGDDDRDLLARVDAWWAHVRARAAVQPERIAQVIRSFERAQVALRRAESLLKPWVIRHLRPRVLASGIARRTRLPGTGIVTGRTDAADGLAIADGALLPFLLAARAQAIVGQLARVERDRTIHYRSTFAEGLASSYEAFLDTRGKREDTGDAPASAEPRDARLRHYLGRLRASLDDRAIGEHPKISAVADRVCELWAQGEKTVVFCHYRMTGRALVKHISRRLDAQLWAIAARRCDAPVSVLRKLARKWRADFADRGEARLRHVLQALVVQLVAAYPGAGSHDRERTADVVLRFVRSEAFLCRFVDLTAANRAAELERVLTAETGGQSLRARLEALIALLFGRLTWSERNEYLDELERLHPGPRYEAPDADETDGGRLVPSVRLATGQVPAPVRRRLLLGFNTPLLPEVLVASSVMAEGVDLHLNCRHIIHHDLDWNPSVIERRTGRVDRIGAKAEQVGRSIEVYLPYVGGTQDEKMYKVVMDRERWFQIVMGERYRTDELATEAAAQRVPLPLAIANELSFRLEVALPYKSRVED